MATEHNPMNNPLLKLTTHPGDVSVVEFMEKSFSQPNQSEKIGAELNGLVDKPANQKIVLDFANVEFIDSTALSMLLALRKKVQAAGGSLVLVHVSPKVDAVLKLTSLDQVLTILPDDAALQRFLDEAGRGSSPEQSDADDTPFTEEELREVESSGLTLGDAIRAIESSMQ